MGQWKIVLDVPDDLEEFEARELHRRIAEALDEAVSPADDRRALVPWWGYLRGGWRYDGDG